MTNQTALRHIAKMLRMSITDLQDRRMALENCTALDLEIDRLDALTEPASEHALNAELPPPITDGPGLGWRLSQEARDKIADLITANVHNAAALHGLVLATLPASGRTALPQPRPTEPSQFRAWLSRQLMDDRLSDAEAYDIVAHFPAISDFHKQPRPTLTIAEANLSQGSGEG